MERMLPRLFWLAAVLAGLWLVDRLIRKLVPAPPPGAGRAVFYPHAWRANVVWFGLVGALVLGMSPFARRDQRLLAAGIGAGFLLIGAALAWEVFRTRISFDERGLAVVSMFGRKQIPWEAIQSMRFAEWGQEFVVEIAGHGRLKFSPLVLEGCEDLVVAIHERLYGPLPEEPEP